MHEILTAEAAQELSRAGALRVMATAEGMSERDRRLAQLMLAGPDITQHDEHAARYPSHRMMVKAVAVAMQQMRAEVGDEKAGARAEMAELSGGRL